MIAYFAGIACSFAILCFGFWVLNCRTSSSSVKKHGGDHIDADPEESKDKISQLPNEIKSSIISLLDITEAARTTILSRRWRDVYSTITGSWAVRFSCCEMADKTPCYESYEREKFRQLRREFIQRVDRFSQLHFDFKIESFELICCFRGCILENLRKWMDSVGRFGVEKLTIGYTRPYNVRGSKPPVFSSDFLRKALSVKHLLLRRCSFIASKQNDLTVLELDSAVVTSEQVESILSNCSSLTSLTFKCCVLPSRLLIQGPDLPLKSLTVYRCSNVAEMHLSAMNLIDLQLCDLTTLNLSLSFVPVLQNLFISFFCNLVPPCVFGKVANDLPHLKHLFFRTQARFFEGYRLAGVNLSNLRELVLLLEFRNKVDLLAVATILDACPFLQEFHLSMMTPSTFDGKRAQKKEVRRHTELKVMKFGGFCGTENEYNFILYILENVVSLQRLTIFLHPDYEVDFNRWIGTAESNPRNDEKKRRIICKRLRGRAISKNVDITIM